MMGVRSCLTGCLHRCAGKSSSDGNVPNLHLGRLWEAGKTNLSNAFQICSSNPFRLANGAGESALIRQSRQLSLSADDRRILSSVLASPGLTPPKIKGPQ